MKNIKITADSTCDIDKDVMKRFQIVEALPLAINLGEASLKDGTFKIEEIYRFVEKSKQLPKTAAASVLDYTDMFMRHTQDGGAVIHFSISSELSASYQNAVLAAKELKNVYVVDGRVLSTGTSLLMLYARDLIDGNPDLDASEVAEICRQKTQSIQASFCVDTLDYLYKGGRCSALSLLGANVLRLHPSLHLKDGKITVGKKYRGKMIRVLTEYIADLREMYPDYDDTRCFITKTECDGKIIEAATQKVKELFNFKEIFQTKAGATITCHCGKGTLGLLFLNKDKA
jgi:DegV family protein with EDD domain